MSVFHGSSLPFQGMVQDPVDTSADHCEKNRRRFSQWSVSIRSKIPCCYDTSNDHCEKKVRATLHFSRWSRCHPNQPFVEPCHFSESDQKEEWYLAGYLHIKNGSYGKFGYFIMDFFWWLRQNNPGKGLDCNIHRYTQSECRSQGTYSPNEAVAFSSWLQTPLAIR